LSIRPHFFKEVESDVRAEGLDVRAEESDVRAEGSDVRAKESDVRAEGSDVRAEGSDARAEGSDVRAKESDVKEEELDVRAEVSDVREVKPEIPQIMPPHLGLVAIAFWLMTAHYLLITIDRLERKKTIFLPHDKSEYYRFGQCGAASD